MNKKTRLLISTCAVAAVFTLAGCNKKTTMDTYRTYYTTEFETLNYMISQSASDHEYTANCVDGLLDTDRFGKLTPTLATAVPEGVYDATSDTTSFKFQIRQGVKWVTHEGTEYAEVKAQDWVSAAEYILNPSNLSETAYMWTMFVEGAGEWEAARAVCNEFSSATAKKTINDIEYTGDSYAKAQGFTGYAEAAGIIQTGFTNTVGVKANGDYELEFTVIGNTPYFTTALNYSPFFPVNASFLQQEGSSFGDDYDNILYCGAYRMTSHDIDSEIIMNANESYYDKDSVKIKTIRWSYANASNTDSKILSRTLFENGNIDGFTVNASDDIGWSKYVTGADGSGDINNPVNENTYTATGTSPFVYTALWNFDRTTHITTDTTYGSTHTTTTYANTQKAIANADFRLALTYGLDWIDYTKNVYGYGYDWAHKGYMPQGLAATTTGKDYTEFFAAEFKEENNLSDYTQEQVVKYLYPNSDTNDQVDLVYSSNKATAAADRAYQTLSAQGVTFPVKVEVRGTYNATQAANLASMFGGISENGAAAIKTTSGQAIFKFELVNPTQQTFTSMTNARAYDILPLMGWGPDYAFPLTYLNTYKINGDMVSYLGFSSENAALQEQILGAYDGLLQDAAKLPVNSEEQYKKFAEAEYQLLYKDAVIIPIFNQASTNVYVSRLVPYSRFRGASGISSYKYKFAELADHTITQTEFEALRTAFRAGNANQLQAEIDKVVGNQYKSN